MLKGKLPSEVVNKRHQYVNALKQFVEEQKEKFQEALQQLGLTEESLAKVEPKQVCPHDPNHWVPEKSFKKHVEKCRLLKAGYQTDELPSQIKNTDFCYEGKNSLKVELDESLINKIIWDDCVQSGEGKQSGEVYTGHRTMPASHIEENINLTQNDRLALYRYVVTKSNEAGAVIPVDKTDELLTTDWGSLVKKGLLDAQNNQNYSSKLEQLAALRDMKRRRQSYRAKNVHITKKSYTEIIREVILNQMEVLVPTDRMEVLVPTDRMERIKESDSEEHKSGNSERKGRERDVDQDSHSRRNRSRSRNRDKRRRYEELETKGVDMESRDKRRRHGEEDEDKRRRHGEEDEDKRRRYGEEDEDKRRRHGEEDDEAQGKDEEGRSRRGDDSYGLISEHSKRDDVKKEPSTSENVDSIASKDGASPSRECSGVSDRQFHQTKRSRSQSPSSSPSSNEDHRHHHKRSKHKKKSKHAKKHSKKHKR